MSYAWLTKKLDLKGLGLTEYTIVCKLGRILSDGVITIMKPKPLYTKIGVGV